MKIHVVKKKEEYGFDAFNRLQDEFNDILTALGCDVWTGENLDRMEINAKQFYTAIQILKSGYFSKEVHEWLDIMKSRADLEIADIIACLQRFYDEADKSDGVIEFVLY